MLFNSLSYLIFLPVVFTIAEGVAASIPFHLVFGAKSIGSGVLAELNTRVDVFMLGYFSSDHLVGVYSFTAILAEGFFQVLVVLRNNDNQTLVKLIAIRDIHRLRDTVRKGMRINYGFMAAISVVAVGLVTNKEDLVQSWPIFAILMGGVTLCAGYAPFRPILLQAGRPRLHTVMITAVVIITVLANLLLIPLLEDRGAAIATALAMVLSVPILVALVRLTVGVRI